MVYFIRNKGKSDDNLDYSLFSWQLKSGDSYPQDKLETIDDFRNYFLTHNVFVCVSNHDPNMVIGAYYVKPNFPGRGSHVCNAGFLVHPDYRRHGLGKFWSQSFLFIARDLGYEASFFNLVYVTNSAAVHIYKTLGFQIKWTGTISVALASVMDFFAS